jgi:transposase InsO family protein
VNRPGIPGGWSSDRRVAQALGISDQSIYTWRRQDRIDRGVEPGLTSAEKGELAAAKRRIAELETELRAMRRAMELVRTPPAGAIIHFDQGVQFASWAFTQRAKDSGLVPSMGSVGDCYDNAMVEAFWSRMQVELLDRHRWRTRVELANAIFDYLELFHNRTRRHSVVEPPAGIEPATPSLPWNH